jgi:aminomethyltransferase
VLARLREGSAMTAQLAPSLHPLKRTPLYALHMEMGAHMAPFAGYDMPIQYGLGVLKEHLHTRLAAGLFDVSHMGQVALRPRSGKVADAARALERMVPIDVLGLVPGRQRYGFFTNDSGGIIDDLMIGHCGEYFALIVNASRKDVDEQHLRDTLSDVCKIDVLEDRALLALQGPAAEAVLARLSPSSASMRFMDIRPALIAGASCLVSRSGYTGEDGFEISVPAQDAEKLARALLQDAAVTLVGLGARDSLRIEAGLCLYGADIDETTTPVEAALQWAIQKVRRRGGARAGNFRGADVVLDQLENGALRCRVGLKPHERTPVRAGAMLFADSSSTQSVGMVTSGTFGPSAAGPVAMGYVPAALSTPGTLLFADVRGNRLPVEVKELPFVAHRYKRT